ncbi:MAG: hypothetical protein AAFY88_23080, partial [Acidobacteriota bacterium]
ASISGRVSTGDLGDFADEVTRVADEIRGHLGLGQGTRRQIEHGRAAAPLSIDARRAYAAAQDAARRFEYRRAAELLVESLRLEPDHPKVLHALSAAWGKLGFRVRAEDASRRAVEHSSGLARHEQMALEARLRILERDWQRAEALYRALWEFYPDDATYGLGVVEAHDRSGNLQAALEGAEVLRRRFGPDPRIDLTVSHVAYHAGDWGASQEAAAKVAARGVELGSPAIEATGLLQGAMTRLRTDQDLTPVERQLARGVALAESVGNRMRTGLGRIYQGDCARRRDRFDEAEAFYRLGLDELEAVGSVHVDRARSSLAILLDRKGRLREGLQIKQQVLQSYRERHVVQGAAIMQENIAISMLKMGRPADALREFEDVERQYVELGDEIGVAWSPYYQGRAWLDRGELDPAEEQLRRAKLAAGADGADGDGDTDRGLHAAVDFERARLAFHRHRLDDARGLVSALVDYYRGLERPFDVAEVQVLWARIEHRAGRLDRAE